MTKSGTQATQITITEMTGDETEIVIQDLATKKIRTLVVSHKEGRDIIESIRNR